MSDHAERVDKIRVIADDPDFRASVSVCSNYTEDGRGCGECYGCWKTMIPLDILGKLDGYEDRFDLDRYRADRKAVFRDLIRFSERPEAVSARETVSQCRRLAEEEKSEAGREFLEVLETIGERS